MTHTPDPMTLNRHCCRKGSTDSDSSIMIGMEARFCCSASSGISVATNMFCLECCDADTNELGNHYPVAKTSSEALPEPPEATNSLELTHPGELGEQGSSYSKSSVSLTASEKFRRPHAGILRGLTLRESLWKGGDLWRHKPQ